MHYPVPPCPTHDTLQLIISVPLTIIIIVVVHLLINLSLDTSRPIRKEAYNAIKARLNCLTLDQQSKKSPNCCNEVYLLHDVTEFCQQRNLPFEPEMNSFQLSQRPEE